MLAQRTSDPPAAPGDAGDRLAGLRRHVDRVGGRLRHLRTNVRRIRRTRVPPDGCSARSVPHRPAAPRAFQHAGYFLQHDGTLAPSTTASRRHVRELRAARGLSLEALAARCDVSRSMISLIERGEASPTAVVLEKLATGLGVPLASLFGAPRRPLPIRSRGAAEQPRLARSAVGLHAAERLAGRRPVADPDRRRDLSGGCARRLRDRRARAARPPADLGARGLDRRRPRRRDAIVSRPATASRCSSTARRPSRTTPRTTRATRSCS